MPRICCVPGCESNTARSKDKQSGTIPTFQFPTEFSRREIWLRNVGKPANFVPTKWTAVCLNHFSPDHVQKYQLVDGRESIFPLEKIKIKENAIPTVFPGIPHKISPQPTQQQQPCSSSSYPSPEVQKCLEIEQQNNDILARDVIKSFADLSNNCATSINIRDYFIRKNADNLIFYLIRDSVDLGCEIFVRVIVRTDMRVKIIIKDRELSNKELSWILPKSQNLVLWSQLENILSHYGTLESHDIDSYRTNLDRSVESLKSAIDFCDDDSEIVTMEILLNQLQLIGRASKQYSKTTLITAFLLYNQSPATYVILREYFTFPHPRYLKKIAATMNVEAEKQESNENYIKNATKNLCEREKKMLMCVDEIYITQKVEYKSGKMVGFAQNEDSKNASTSTSYPTTAKTVTAFLIKSVFGHFECIAKLIPTNKMSGVALKELMIDVINEVQKINDIEIIGIVTDNNKVNVKAFCELTGVEKPSYITSFENPSHPEKRIFLFYDSVHIIKNVRNNWLNLEKRKSFNYPEFQSYEVKTAHFWDIRELFEKEMAYPVRKAFKLNYKTLYPNRFERQNVQLALNVFDDSTYGALKQHDEYASTGDFVKIILEWWKVSNVKNLFKGDHKRDEFCKPITSPTDRAVLFLVDFLAWLEVFENSDSKFTDETFHAIKFTSKSFLEFIGYAFRNFPIQYILLGKIQSDNLERRFGKYRYLSGCTYHISLCDLLQSEKKLRIRQILRSDVEMDDFKEIENVSSEDEYSGFQSVLMTNYLAEAIVDEQSQTYVGGYAAGKLAKSIHCEECRKIFMKSKGMLSGNDDYFDLRQRGGLVIPTTRVLQLFFHMSAIFLKIRSTPQLFDRFVKSRCPKQILTQLTLESIHKDGFLIDESNTCAICDLKSSEIFTRLCSKLANTLLKNQASIANSEITSKKPNERKLKTFS